MGAAAEDLSMFGVQTPTVTPQPAPAASGEDLSMFGVGGPKQPLTAQQMAANVHPLDDTIKYATDYVKGLGAGFSQYKAASANTSPLEAVISPIKAVASIGTSVGSAITSPFRYAADRLSGGNTAFTQFVADGTYQPGGQAGAEVGLLGAVTKPIADVFHGISKGFTDDPEIQAQIEDGLQIASMGLAPEVSKPGAIVDVARAQLAKDAPTIATHPSVVAANDLAGKYNIKLTKGQQVAQAATDLPPEETATAKALTVPYQIEAKTATQTGAAGKAYSNYFATQQNQLASHIQDVADAVRAQGDTVAADKIEGAIVEKSPGVNAVNGRTLQRVVDKDLVADPALASKLNDLNDLSGVIDAPPKAPIAPQSVVSKIVDHFTSVPALTGESLGAAAGTAVGHATGIPFGGVVGGAAGGAVGGYVGGLLKRAPAVGDLSTLTVADITKMAKSAGITPEEMAQRLTMQPKATSAPATAATPAAASPVPTNAAPATAPAVPATTTSVVAPAAAAPVTAATFPPELLDLTAWKKHLADNVPKTSAEWQDRIALTEAREDAMRAQGINPRAQPGSAFSGTNLEKVIEQRIRNGTAANKTVNYLAHKIRMERDPEYRAARLLQAGIIED